MKVSLNTVKNFTTVEHSIDELVAKINSQLGTVEHVTNLNDVYKDAVIVKVVSAEKHPNADKLSICRVDDGGVVSNIERGDDGLVQVVCGAPNVNEGMFAVWLPPQSVVPSTYHDDQPFVLGARELRGEMSQGMLAAADELAIGSDHEGIMVIDPEQWRPIDVAITPGVRFASAYGLDDYIIDIENKMFTHRPDLFGQLGVAREIAGINQRPFVSPDWYREAPSFDEVDDISLCVINDATDVVPRFLTVVIDGVIIKPSPLWLQAALVAMGSKPINNVVDITNYIMLLTAQPTHAYDYAKIRGQTIGARMARKGESVTLLNGKTYSLDEQDIVIADNEGPIGLAGIMGGSESEVDDSTKTIVLEVANFNMYTLRKTSMRHGIFTEALTRFNKGQSPLQNDVIMRELMHQIFDIAGGTQASSVSSQSYEATKDSIRISSGFVNDRLGLELTNTDIQSLLENVEIKVEAQDELLIVSSPFWRTDLECAEDVVEEVGRLYGFDHLPRIIPLRPATPTFSNHRRKLNDRVRQVLSSAGASEVLTYSFVHQNILAQAQQDSSSAYKISNALSPELQYYRMSIIPSLLDKTYMNIRAGNDEFALFEIGKAHHKTFDDIATDLPVEYHRLGFVYSSRQPREGAAYYRAREYSNRLFEMLGLQVHYHPLASTSSEGLDTHLLAPFDSLRSALIIDELTKKVVGIIGEYKSSVARAFKLPNYSAGFELVLDDLEVMSNELSQYQPLSKFPSTSRDISFVVDTDILYKSIIEASRIEEESVNIHYFPVNIYQGSDTSKKTISIRYTYTPHNETLSSERANGITQRIINAVTSSTDAEIAT